MLLEELASKKTVNIDFHNHCQTGGKFKENESPLAEGFSNLVGLLDKIRKSSLDILYVTNYGGDDQRLENWTSPEQLHLAREAGYEVEQGDYYTFFKKDNEINGLGKSQEVPTNQGHALFAGLKRNKQISSGKSLDETLAEATDNESKIADHPYAIVEKSGILMYSRRRKQDAQKFDALEKNGNFSFFSMPFSLANYFARRAGKKYRKPVVANSDGHHPKDIGKTYNIFKAKDLDYSSEKTLRDSINYAVKNDNFETRFTPIPFWRVFHHVLMVGIYIIKGKLSKIRERTGYEPAFAPAPA
jgi:hypothetical protein